MDYPIFVLRFVLSWTIHALRHKLHKALWKSIKIVFYTLYFLQNTSHPYSIDKSAVYALHFAMK